MLNKNLIIIIALIMLPAFLSAEDWKEKIGKQWETAKQSSVNLYQGFFSNSDEFSCFEKNDSKELSDKWDDLLTELEQSSVKLDEMINAPDSSWFGEDKKSLRKDFNILLDETIGILLSDTPAVLCLDKYRLLSELQKDFRQQLAKHREMSFSLLGEEQKKNEKKIKDLQDKIEELKGHSKSIIEQMKDSLARVNINMTNEQINALLSRVDATNIVHMSVLFDMIKQTNLQLEKLMQINQDNFKSTRKYYAMHVILTEMMVYMQQQYLDLIDYQYIPGIERIELKLMDIQSETEKMLDDADNEHKVVYENNLKAQKLSLKTASLYKSHLYEQSEKVKQAKAKAMKDLNLANNTYQTVQLSLELLSMLKSSRQSFRQLMQLQLPEIIPFSDKNIEKEYQQLTTRLHEDSQ